MSLVNKLANEWTGRVSDKERPAKKSSPKLTEKLAAEFFDKPLAISKMAEVRFEKMEDAQKAVTKVYEQMDKVREDLLVTGQTLQQKNLDLAAQKVLDMAHSVEEARSLFQDKFPHLMQFEVPASPGTVEMPEEYAEPEQEAPAPPPQQPQSPQPQPSPAQPTQAPAQPAGPQRELM